MLPPRLREADAGTAVLADGFSCRTQIHEFDSGGHEAVHLAEPLARGLPGTDGSAYGVAPGARPTAPGRRVQGIALAGVGLARQGRRRDSCAGRDDEARLHTP
ncbi:hypothetical protein [Streptomyces sp. NPDC051001]|uniref:hypothetical protein n=1 Tax=Streptomyces sp. NPDC051001 TaxID=3155795 RepID=UPI00342DD793